MRIPYCMISISGLVVAAMDAIPPANAWGADGHIIVAEIAQSKLKPSVRQQVTALLHAENARFLSDIANWADEERAAVKKGKSAAYPMPSHVTRIPLDHSRSLGKSCPNFCAVKAIDYYADRLSDRTLSDRERALALNFVVHLIGDLHQPLHSSYKVGNFTPVVFIGRRRMLHWVWDTGILKAQNKPRSELIEEIEQVKVRPRGDVVQWALEGRDIARDKIFPNLTKSAEAVVLPPDYAARS